MNEREILAIFDREVLADRAHGHILLEQPRSAACLGRARMILAQLGRAVLKEVCLPPRWLLVALEEGDVRDAVLVLGESGFTVLKGANSLQR